MATAKCPLPPISGLIAQASGDGLWHGGGGDGQKPHSGKTTSRDLGIGKPADAQVSSIIHREQRFGVYLAPQPSTWRGRSEQISLDQGGCEARTIPAEGGAFFLDFSLYRTYRDFALFVTSCRSGDY